MLPHGLSLITTLSIEGGKTRGCSSEVRDETRRDERPVFSQYAPVCSSGVYNRPHNWKVLHADFSPYFKYPSHLRHSGPLPLRNLEIAYPTLSNLRAEGTRRSIFPGAATTRSHLADVSAPDWIWGDPAITHDHYVRYFFFIEKNNFSRKIKEC